MGTTSGLLVGHKQLVALEGDLPAEHEDVASAARGEHWAQQVGRAEVHSAHARVANSHRPIRRRSRPPRDPLYRRVAHHLRKSTTV